VALTPDRSALDIARLAAGRPIPSRIALLLGAEGPGLGAGTRAAADLQLQIVMAPGVDSLNVSTAAAIALHRLRSAARSELENQAP
jgi:tRNA G18 (ribose-2'-O)-methylase SpoU